MTDNEYIEKYRVSIMGVAALWIMMFHGTMEIPIRAINTLIGIGYLGVDIFMFMSGFSMHHSFINGCKRNVRLFYRKRIKRIFPTFIPFAILWYMNYLFTNYADYKKLEVAVHTKEFWITMAIFRWFVPCICLCYILTPLIDKILLKFKNRFLTVFWVVLLCVLISTFFIGSSVALMILIRIPEFLIGYWYADRPNKQTNIFCRAVVLVIVYVFYYWLLGAYDDVFLADTGLYWWPAIAFTSSMVLCLSRCKILNNQLINFCGKYSLELYLWHVYILFPILNLCNKFNINFDQYYITVNILAIFVACFVSWIYAKIISFFTSICKKDN